MVIKFIENLSNWSGKIVSFTVCIMMVIIGKEVISRYFFNAPSIWAPEWIPVLCGMYCILGGAYTMASRGHVNVDLIYNNLSDKRKAIFDLITLPVGLLFFAALFYGSARFAWMSIAVFEDSGTTARTPVWIAKAMLPLGTFLMGTQWICNIVLDCQKAFRKRKI